jgi:Uma2 family endonuclease
MSTATLISLDEYLHTSYRPDCDYVDGEVVERNLGKHEHARVQYALGGYFSAREKLWGIYGLTEQRTQVAPRRVRISDICVLLDGQQIDDVLQVPPFLCVEILSPDDTMSSMQERIDDYLNFGVPNVWVIDPRRARCYVFTKGAMVEAKDNILRTSNPDIVVPANELFESLR